MNNIVVTAFDNNIDYFYRGMVLIAALHRTSFDSVDKIIVYNLGFDEEKKKMLNDFAKVEVMEFPSEIANIYDGYLSPKQFAYKTWVLKKGGDFGQNILWIDAGIAPLVDISSVFDIVEREEIFLVNNSEGQFIKNLTHSKCIQAMNADQQTINQLMISAGLIGYKKDGKYQEFIDKAFEFSKIKEVAHGHHSEHRHDQSIYSILAVQYNIPRKSFDKYANWKLLNNDEQVFWVHRSELSRLDGIVLKNGEKFIISKNISNIIGPKIKSIIRRIKIMIAKLIGRI